MTQDARPAKPPYVSFKTFLNFLDWLEEDGVPSRLDRSFWGERLSGVYGFQLMSGLRFLGLIDDSNRPHPDLENMARDRERRRSLIRERLSEGYAAALKGLNLERASLGELEDRLRLYSIDGETLRKALAFFIHAAEYSGMPLSNYITKKSRIAKRTDGSRKRGRLSRRSSPEEGLPTDRPIIDMAPTHQLHSSIEGLLADLAKTGQRWTKEERDRWVNAFITNIDYAYPAREA